MRKIVGFSFLVLTFSLLSLLAISNPKNANANVGTANIRSTTSEDYRCFAASLIMPDKTYLVSVNCANLIYPPLPPEVSSYVLWGTPPTGKGVIKLGDLAKGEARFVVKQSFTSLYVTIEPNVGAKIPSKNIIMSGNIEPISFLQRPTSPTPTIEPTKAATEQPKKTTDTTNLSTKDKLVLALRRAGIAAIIALVAIVGLIFVVTRSRG